MLNAHYYIYVLVQLVLLANWSRVFKTIATVN